MATDAPTLSPALPRLPALRWLLLGALLVAELLLLTLRFDTGSLAGLGTWWADLLGKAHALPQVAVAIAAATFLIGGGRLRDDLRRASSEGAHLPLWPFLLGHFAALAGFWLLTHHLLEGDARSSPWAGAWAVAWLVSAALVLLLWAAMFLPAPAWLPLARRSAGPLLGGLFIGLAAWGTGQLTDAFWVPLSRYTFWLVVQLLRLGTADVVCDPEGFVVGTSAFSVRIAPECSGYEGIGLVWVFVGTWLWCYRERLRFPAALLLLPAATLAIWLLNAVRIAGLIAVGSWVSREAALGGFHSQAGWLAFNAVALGAVALADRLPWFRARREEAQEPTVQDEAPAHLLPLMALLATMMVTAAFTSGFDWPYPLRVLAVAAALWLCRKSYAGLRLEWTWAAVGIGAAVYVLWLLLEPPPPEDGAAHFAEALRGAPPLMAFLWLAFRVVGTVITVPIAEELAFRGYLIRRMVSPDAARVPPGTFTWVSFLGSSLLFGLLHGRWLAGTVAGMAYALALYRRGKAGDAILAHAVTNALLAVHVLATGAWWLW
ncbi:MAG: exosortase E/protease, VPEID-CTERM system [Gemmataceae bacterium]|nr:exosortase E/protease, VPEID-CTERM system [Gemmataceae bacterium]